MSRIKVERLTPDQTRRLGEYRDRWLAVEAVTAPADRAAAEEGVCHAYQAAGLSPPARMEWVGGPNELAIKWSEAKSRGSVGENVKWCLFDQVVARAVARIDEVVSFSVRDVVWHGTRASSASPRRIGVNDAVMQAIGDVRPSLWTRLRRVGYRIAGRGRAGRLSFQESGWGQHDIAWFATYQYLHDIAGLTAETEALKGVWQVSQNVGWIVPHQDVCWLAERHHVLKTDDRGRLHSAFGPALGYPDGWSVHMWKGVHMPPWMIENPHRITYDMIDRHPDPVVRRCMIEIITPASYVQSGVVARVSQDETGTLWRKSWWGPDAWAAVEVVNGTAENDGSHKHYFLQVPPTMRTAREAVAWTYGMTEAQYTRLRLRT